MEKERRSMKYKIERNSGQVWCQKLNIQIINPCGWNSIDDFNHNLIHQEEFLNRASNSVIVPPKKQSRREVSKLKKKLM
jgi:hypothetical protein